jgi:hypothetical protein
MICAVQAVDDSRSLKELDESAPKQGLRAFVLDAEERTV